MTAPTTLLVGLGSPYGDDQVGWQIVESIEKQFPDRFQVAYAQSADEVLDWLEGVERVVICDACHGAGEIGSHHQWTWPTAELPPLHSTGSHDMGLTAVLEMAQRLGLLPPDVTIWAVEGYPPAPVDQSLDAPLSPLVAQAVPRVAALIASAL